MPHFEIKNPVGETVMIDSSLVFENELAITKKRIESLLPDLESHEPKNVEAALHIFNAQVAYFNKLHAKIDAWNHHTKVENLKLGSKVAQDIRIWLKND